DRPAYVVDELVSLVRHSCGSHVADTRRAVKPAGPLHTGAVRVSLRPSRQTNLALLVLLTGAFVTGWVAFGVDGPRASRVVAVAHATLGLGIVVLAPWKTVIVRRGLRRGRRHGLAVAFGVAVSVSLAAGIVHATLGPLEVAGISVLAVHVGAAVL